MIIRLYCDQALASDTEIALSEAQGHYLRNVMRRKLGDPLRLFNAQSGEYQAEIIALDKKAAGVRLGVQLRQPQPEADLWLLFAPVKRQAMETIVQKAVELGVAQLQPVITERVNVARINTERLASIAMEAAEQCERLSVPMVRPAAKLTQVMAEWPTARHLIFCDEAGDDPNQEWGGREGRAPSMLSQLRGEQPPGAVLIGPEGGFSAPERALLRSSSFARSVSLGPRILRADTAAITALSLWQAILGDL